MTRKYRNCKTKLLRQELAKKQKNGHAIHILIDLFFKIVEVAETCDCGYKACQIYNDTNYVKRIKNIVNNA